MKILFWLNGSGGQRTERKVVDLPWLDSDGLNDLSIQSLIDDALFDWKEELNCNSEYVRWGWDNVFDSVKLEPLSKQ